MKNYLRLEKEMESIGQVNNVINLLYWDIATYMLKGSAESRGMEIANLTIIANNMLKSEKISDLLQKTKEESSLDTWQLANIREIERTIREVSYIDDNLQRNYIAATTQCEIVWRSAKKDNNYNKLRPYLQRVLDCVKEIASIKSDNLSCTKYDALLDIYDPERTTQEIKETYSIIKRKIPILIQKITEKQRAETSININIAPEQQYLVCSRIAEILGFDFNQGRIDRSGHPSCRGTPHDVRLTNRYEDFIAAVMGIIHEVGHGLYEQNLPNQYKNQPVGQAKGMAIHESQSLLMEMQVGRSREFMEYLAKILRDEFHLTTSEYSSDNLYKLVTRVKPGFIRVDADEVTYLMHNILRFEIEDALINEQMILEELPEVWNKKMQEYLGIMPTSNKNGCMQDIHWNLGTYGYFPAYSKIIGNRYA
ncbi:MAG: carboxypeptidase M32 [Rickettsia endosymbiont of Bryobia graminum]|nr:carboxypeptidase M32 [Rickettsia endosymbiont of Bryobia graminum]